MGHMGVGGMAAVPGVPARLQPVERGRSGEWPPRSRSRPTRHRPHASAIPFRCTRNHRTPTCAVTRHSWKRFGDQRGIGPVAPREAGERAVAGAFLLDHRLHEDIGRRGEPAGAQRIEREEVRGKPPPSCPPRRGHTSSHRRCAAHKGGLSHMSCGPSGTTIHMAVEGSATGRAGSGCDGFPTDVHRVVVGPRHGGEPPGRSRISAMSICQRSTESPRAAISPAIKSCAPCSFPRRGRMRRQLAEKTVCPSNAASTAWRIFVAVSLSMPCLRTSGSRPRGRPAAPPVACVTSARPTPSASSRKGEAAGTQVDHSHVREDARHAAPRGHRQAARRLELGVAGPVGMAGQHHDAPRLLPSSIPPPAPGEKRPGIF